ncbi:ankyrin-3-like isoform X2 [Chenopodium quinoa]|uniref:ankyrin-3-like isoform X2 n=1 Tax=Chenopodium quinoa TaxID=63459 RepID=UPI000B796FBD|nr:ankyrin-3-like isoform X2 [Chenopodium quinoa]
MDKELYEAAAGTGDVTIFDRKDTTGTNDVDGTEIKYNKGYFVSRTPNGSTILHLATQNGHSAFIKETLKHFPTLVLSRDFNGDTVIHIAARLKNPAAVDMVRCFDECCRKLKEIKLEGVVSLLPPWVTKNSKGDTAMHKAVRVSNHNVAEVLSKICPALSEMTNDAGETPLHIYARYATYTVEDKLDIFVCRLMWRTSPAYTKDVDGFTPIMRAAQSGRIRVALYILQAFPQSMEIRDFKGRNFLHYLNIKHLELVDGSEDPSYLCENFFETFPAIDSLRTAQDEDGNTPLHFAIITGNLLAAKLLMQRCLQSEERAELTITNNDGCSIFELLASQPSDIEEMSILNQKHLKEIILAKKFMDRELYIAAMQGDVTLFNNIEDKSYFLTQTPDGSNIVHIALRPGKDDTSAFVEEALTRIPTLIYKTDNNGDTPFHLAAKWHSPASVKLLENLPKYHQNAIKENSQSVYIPPWKIKNSKGNMPIHEALCTNNMYAAILLICQDPEGGSYVNDAGETPLHTFARCSKCSIQDMVNFTENLIPESISTVYMRDNKGLTPLLRAAESGRIKAAQFILEHCPQSAQLCDPSGRTFLHLLRFHKEFPESALSDAGLFKFFSDQLFKYPEVDAQRTVQDCDGNTPLHYALKTGNSIAAELLKLRCFETEERPELALINNENEGLIELLAESYKTSDQPGKLPRKDSEE